MKINEKVKKINERIRNSKFARSRNKKKKTEKNITRKLAQTTNRIQIHRKFVENEKLGKKRKIRELKVPVKTQHERTKTRKGISLNNSQNI